MIVAMSFPRPKLMLETAAYVLVVGAMSCDDRERLDYCNDYDGRATLRMLARTAARAASVMLLLC